MHKKMNKIIIESSTYYEGDNIGWFDKQEPGRLTAWTELSEQVTSELRTEYQEVAWRSRRGHIMKEEGGVNANQ